MSWSPKFSYGSRDGWPAPRTSPKTGSSGTGQGEAYSPLSGVFGRPPQQEKGLDPNCYNSHHKALQPPAVNCQTNTCLTGIQSFDVSDPKSQSWVSALNNTIAHVLVRRKVNILNCDSYFLWLLNAKLKKLNGNFFNPCYAFPLMGTLYLIEENGINIYWDSTPDFPICFCKIHSFLKVWGDWGYWFKWRLFYCHL